MNAYDPLLEDMETTEMEGRSDPQDPWDDAEGEAPERSLTNFLSTRLLGAKNKKNSSIVVLLP